MSNSDNQEKRLVKTDRWSTLKVRIRSAIILALVAFTLIVFSSTGFMLLMVFLAIVGLDEFYCLVERKGSRPLRRVGNLWLLGTLLAAWFGPAFLGLSFFMGLFAVLNLAVIRASRRSSVLADVAVTILGNSYLSLFAFIPMLRLLEGQFHFGGWAVPAGAVWLLVVILLCAITDISAYFAGRQFGRRALAPAISPKKTVEGSLVGVLSAGSFLAALAPYLGLQPSLAFGFGCLVSVHGQVGDLWESALKREMEAKDSGDLISGHGGVLDRFDSLAFAAPAFFLGGRFLGWF